MCPLISFSVTETVPECPSRPFLKGFFSLPSFPENAQVMGALGEPLNLVSVKFCSLPLYKMRFKSPILTRMLA